MATLTIRNLPDKIRDRLRLRAAKNGVSMEAEARAIIAEAMKARVSGASTVSVSDLQDWIAATRKKFAAHPNSSTTLLRDRRREAILEVMHAGREPKEVFGREYRRILSEADWSEDHVKSLKQSSR